jgi:hypothetical protein
VYPHEEKLRRVLLNKKLPSKDKKRVEELLKKYKEFLRRIEALPELKKEEDFKKFSDIVNDYKFYMDFNFIFESPENFLYRQKGQLKIESSFIEELLIHLFRKSLPELEKKGFLIGPTEALLKIYFLANMNNLGTGGRITLKEKSIDFAVFKPIHLRSSFQRDFSSWEEKTSSLSFINFECKTNLDKTMFQEIVATASELKSVLPSAKYFVICEWLDMKPISTSSTPIDEVIILRGKRLAQKERNLFSLREERLKRREFYKEYLKENPIRHKSLLRIVKHIREILESLEGPDESSVLDRGYF